jgi:uncharacterized membrane protein YfcA
MEISDPNLAYIAAVFFSGLVAGFFNVVAGGGSLLTLPVLIFLGLPAATANATNRVGILLQNVVATATFRRRGLLDVRLGLRLMLAAAPGAVLGALMAVEMDDRLFRWVLAGIMLLVLVSLIRRRRHPGPGGAPAAAARPQHPLALYASFFFVGFHSGFIQAGVGFVIIAALNSFGGLGLVRSNGIKVMSILMIQAIALGIFAALGSVNWVWGLTLAAGTMLGGWAGVRWQVIKGELWVYRILVGAIIAFALMLLFYD